MLARTLTLMTRAHATVGASASNVDSLEAAMVAGRAAGELLTVTGALLLCVCVCVCGGGGGGGGRRSRWCWEDCVVAGRLAGAVYVAATVVRSSSWPVVPVPLPTHLHRPRPPAWQTNRQRLQLARALQAALRGCHTSTPPNHRCLQRACVCSTMCACICYVGLWCHAVPATAAAGAKQLRGWRNSAARRRINTAWRAPAAVAGGTGAACLLAEAASSKGCTAALLGWAVGSHHVTHSPCRRPASRKLSTCWLRWRATRQRRCARPRRLSWKGCWVGACLPGGHLCALEGGVAWGKRAAAAGVQCWEFGRSWKARL